MGISISNGDLLMPPRPDPATRSKPAAATIRTGGTEEEIGRRHPRTGLAIGVGQEIRFAIATTSMRTTNGQPVARANRRMPGWNWWPSG